MPTLSQPELLPGPFAYNGDKNDIPDASASLGAASYQQGFPPITQLPVNAGGIPPQRNDFNGILNALSQHTFWQQSGGMYAWSATLDYAVPSMVVGSDKELYFALQPSGPGTAAGAKNPTSGAGKAYWQNIAYVLPVATATKLGGVMVNKGGLQVSASGLLSLLLMQGGGLNLNAAGQLYVDTADFSEEMLRAFLEGIIADGGGLGFDSSGKLYVDADAFSDDLLERFLKSIRVPIWLAKNINFYVALSGSDILDEGRGLSVNKPFRTVQAAVNYVSTTYNLYIYNATIHIAAGDYGTDIIRLPDYTATTGRIQLVGATENAADTKIGLLSLLYSARYDFFNFTAKAARYSGQFGVIQSTNGLLSLYNIYIDCTEIASSTNSPTFGLIATGSGRIEVPASNNQIPLGVRFLVSENNHLTAIISGETGGAVAYSADIEIDGTTTVSATVRATLGGLVYRSRSSSMYPGRLPTVTAKGIITGARYLATGNSIVDSRGGGPDFYPGTLPGSISSGGQYI